MNFSSKPDREKEIFGQALDLPSAEARLGYLQGACGGDAELLARVQTLLRAHEAADGFLPDTPGAAADPTVSQAMADRPEKPGTMIGRYKLLEKIGEGGFGSVHMAEQEVPVRRRVALKVIKLGMDTKEVVARFEAERQALAMMDHPNIAKVLDAGATETGRPYFVMELVKGVPITAYCDQRQLSTSARLELFIQVCQAVQHAHQKGIIHRDLKPSNILVTEQDDRPVPKVIDFGVARATQARLTEKTMFTQFHQLIGTPAYMSPEQTGLANLDIDTRSDIYSLGVLLYELLTGCTPFEPQKLLAAGYEGVMRMIREVEPPKPSTRLSLLSMQELTALGGRRQEEPRRLGRRVQGDLDWIVMKALEKDRTRRYETATSLAQDIHRHLSNETVSARPPSASYRLQKLARRHRVALTAATAIAAALLIGTGVATWQAIRAGKAEREARKQAVRSERVAMALKSFFSEISPTVLRGQDTKLLRALLDEAMDRLPQEFASEPEVLADILGSFGGVYFDLRDFDKWKELATRRLELIRKMDPVPPYEEVDALGAYGVGLIDIGDVDTGERLLGEAMSRAERLADARREEIIENLKEAQADALDFRRDLRRANEVRVEILEAKRRRLGSQHLEVAEALSALAGLGRQLNDPARGEAYIREALAIRKRHLPDGDALVLDSTVGVADAMIDHGSYRSAETLLRRQLKAIPEPVTLKSWRRIGRIQSKLIVVLSKRNDLEGALALAREQLAFAKTHFMSEHMQIGVALLRLCEVLRKKGDFTEAETVARELGDFWDNLNDPNDRALYVATRGQF